MHPAWLLLPLLGLMAVVGLSRPPARAQSAGMSTIAKQSPRPVRGAIRKSAITGLPVAPHRPGRRKVTAQEIRALRDKDA